MRAKKILTARQITKLLKQLPDWSTNPNQTFLKATYPQPDYISGLAFIAKIAVHSEIQQHHPDITYTYNAVTVKLTTHEHGGITEQDAILATKISALAHKKVV